MSAHDVGAGSLLDGASTGDAERNARLVVPQAAVAGARGLVEDKSTLLLDRWT
ncbi:MAG: hypothetical protein M3O46_07530 [Myxococcota bacterium]|nr:hypothetical protein [Myxococcota bacterium]